MCMHISVICVSLHACIYMFVDMCLGCIISLIYMYVYVFGRSVNVYTCVSVYECMYVSMPMIL